MVSQLIQHAGIGDRYSEMVCLFRQAIKPSDHFAGVTHCAAIACQFVLEKP